MAKIAATSVWCSMKLPKKPYALHSKRRVNSIPIGLMRNRRDGFSIASSGLWYRRCFGQRWDGVYPLVECNQLRLSSLSSVSVKLEPLFPRSIGQSKQILNISNTTMMQSCALILRNFKEKASVQAIKSRPIRHWQPCVGRTTLLANVKTNRPSLNPQRHLSPRHCNRRLALDWALA